MNCRVRCLGHGDPRGRVRSRAVEIGRSCALAIALALLALLAPAWRWRQLNLQPDLTIQKSHSGTFAQGDIGQWYTILVSNVGSAPTKGLVRVLDRVPPGIRPTVISGWYDCSVSQAFGPRTIACERSDPLPPGSHYPALRMKVNVDAEAPAILTNRVEVGGGGENNTTNNNAADLTIVQSARQTAEFPRLVDDCGPCGAAWRANDGGMQAIAWGSGRFVAVGGNWIVTSEDGVRWVRRRSGVEADLQAIAWTGAGFVAVGDHGTIISSAKGIDWQQRHSGVADKLFDVAANDRAIVAVGGGKDNGLALTSRDGATWVAHTVPGDESLSAIAVQGNQFFSVAGNTMLRSRDGETWSALHSAPRYVDLLAAGPQRLVAVASDHVFSSADDGASWEHAVLLGPEESATWVYWRSWVRSERKAEVKRGRILKVAWVGKEFAAVVGTHVLTSTNGLSWKAHPTGLCNGNLRAVIGDGTTIVAIGDSGEAVSSRDRQAWRTVDALASCRGLNYAGGSLPTSPR